MSMPAGKLRHRVNIQSPSQSQDDVTGETTTTWTTIHADVPCAIEPLSVRDFLQSSADQSEVSVRITIRYRAELRPTMRIVGLSGVYKDRVFTPKGWFEDKDSGREYLTAPCTEMSSA